MTQPIIVDLPHQLGAQEAKRRIANGVHTLGNHIPGGANVQHHWAGDSVTLDVAALNQNVTARLDIRDTVVRVEVVLPPALGFFGRAIEKALRKRGTTLLEDKSSATRPA